MALLFNRMVARCLPTILSHRPAVSVVDGGRPQRLGLVHRGPHMQRLTGSLDFQSQALVLRAERQRLIASNIANADTPGYQAREMDFANALRQASHSAGAGAAGVGGGMDVGSSVASSTLHTTHPAHDDASVDLRGLGADAPGLLYARHSQDAIDRNTVELDRERASFVDNSVKYEATLRFINGSMRSMLDAMKSPNQG